MECKLCKQEKKLIKRSHIIPNFMFDGIYDEKHQLLSAFLDPVKKEKLLNTSHYDKDILCLECDRDIIGKYETYASKALYGGKLKEYEQPKRIKRIAKDGYISIDVTNISYKKFKLFLLSILWRASVSKQSFFKRVRLGPHEEVIRRMIYDGNAGEENQYKTCLILTKDNKKINTQMVAEPRRFKVSSRTFYSFFINKAYYMINISSDTPLEIFDKSTIKLNNSMNIPLLEGNFLIDFYDSFFGSKLRIKD